VQQRISSSLTAAIMSGDIPLSLIPFQKSAGYDSADFKSATKNSFV
jgi:hypothetical protein